MDWDSIRYVIKKASSAGFDRVTVQSGDCGFQFEIDLDTAVVEEPVNLSTSEQAPTISSVIARQVGVFDSLESGIAVGQKVDSGQKLGEILALGLVNEVVANCSGVIRSVEVEPGTPVEYGKVLVQIEQ